MSRLSFRKKCHDTPLCMVSGWKLYQWRSWRHKLDSNGDETDNGSIPESFDMNGGLKLRVVWTISLLIAASARHYLLQPIIAEHKTLESLVLTDGDGQGVLPMNKEQLEELRVKPLFTSSASKRTLVPALSMRLWYVVHLVLPNGTVLKRATLVAIRPGEHPKKEVLESEANWVASAFEEPFGTAARMLLKGGLTVWNEPILRWDSVHMFEVKVNFVVLSQDGLSRA